MSYNYFVDSKQQKTLTAIFTDSVKAKILWADVALLLPPLKYILVTILRKGGYKMEAVAQKVSELEKAMMELVYQSRLTEMNINRLSDEIRESKNNMEMNINRLS